MNKFLAFMCGLILGGANWYVLYKLYKTSFAANKKKLSIAILTVLKTLLLFALLYIVIVVIKFNVLYVIMGIVVSLIIMNIVALRVKY